MRHGACYSCGVSAFEVITVHIPTYKKYNNADCAVIFIHGFMGSPNQFTDLAEAVYNIGCTYMSVLLPGHGGGTDEFVRFGTLDWQRHVQSEIDKIKHDYKKIFLVGHSMGGLLALNASLVKDNNISGVVLISTPLKTYLLNPKSLLRKLRLLLLPKNNEIKSAYIKSNSVAAKKFWHFPLAVKPVMNFYRLVRQTNKRLPEVVVPVCMFHSRNDETTSYKSAGILYERLCSAPKTAFSLDKSWHAFYVEDEREIIKNKLIEFIVR